MSNTIEYQVDKSGTVVKCRTEQGTEYDVSFQAKPADFSPPKSRMGRWAQLKAQACRQTPGIWYVYSGFPDEEELKRARNALNKPRSDAFLKEHLSGRDITINSDPSRLELYVKLTEG